jgi:hypothetical protein
VCLFALYRLNGCSDFNKICRGPICVLNLDPLLFSANSTQQFRNQLKFTKIFNISPNFPTLHSLKFLLFLRETLQICVRHWNKVCLKILEPYLNWFSFYSPFFVFFCEIWSFSSYLGKFGHQIQRMIFHSIFLHPILKEQVVLVCHSIKMVSRSQVTLIFSAITSVGEALV